MQMDINKLVDVSNANTHLQQERTEVNSLVESVITDSIEDYLGKLSSLDKSLDKMTDEEVLDFFTDENGEMTLGVPPFKIPKTRAQVKRSIRKEETFGESTLYIYETLSEEYVEEYCGLGVTKDTVIMTNLETFQPVAYMDIVQESDVELFMERYGNYVDKKNYSENTSVEIDMMVDKIKKVIMTLLNWSKKPLDLDKTFDVFSYWKNKSDELPDEDIQRKQYTYFLSVYSVLEKVKELDQSHSFKVEFCRDFLELSLNTLRVNRELDEAQLELNKSYEDFGKKIDGIQSELSGNMSLSARTLIVEEISEIEEKEDKTVEDVKNLEHLRESVKNIDGVLELDWLFSRYGNESVIMNLLSDYRNQGRVTSLLEKYNKRMKMNGITPFKGFRDFEMKLDERFHNYVDLFTLSVIRAYTYVSIPTSKERIFAPQLNAFLRGFVMEDEDQLIESDLEYKKNFVNKIEEFLDMIIEVDKRHTA